MIIKSNCKPYELYLTHILSEIFPPQYLCENNVFELMLSRTCDGFQASVSHNSVIASDTTSALDFPSEATAITSTIGRAVIMLAKKFGYSEPPYGVLTGVRPIKIASDIIATNPIEEYYNVFEQRYLVRRDKSELLLDCAKYDNIARSSHSPSDVSIYISIPFCPSRCNYCSFVSSSIEKKKHLIDPYLNILLEEIILAEKVVSKNQLTVKSIYVGGGTPGILDEEQLEKLLSSIYSTFYSNKIKEFTFEIGRPDTVTRGKLELLKKFCVDRISINTQSTNDHVLETIGRKHTSFDYFNALFLAKDIGFNSINTDLIAGLSTETFESFQKSLFDVINAGVNNITIHTLALKKSARIKEEKTELTTSDMIDEFVSFSKKHCISCGFEPYYLYRQKNSIGNHESVGYCKNGNYSHYNIAMMNEVETVIGLGAGATSRVVGTCDSLKYLHFENYKYPDDYIRDKTKMISHLSEIDEALKQE